MGLPLELHVISLFFHIRRARKRRCPLAALCSNLIMLICSSFIILLKSREEEKSVFGSDTFSSRTKGDGPSALSLASCNRSIEIFEFYLHDDEWPIFWIQYRKGWKGWGHKYMYDKKSVK